MSDFGQPGSWQLTLWGSRGSVPVSAPRFSRYGGDTTCLELDLPSGRIIIDAGSGIVELSRRRRNDTKPTLLLFSHLHWDHVLGLPFFAPLYRPGWDLDVRGVSRSNLPVLDAVTQLNRPPLFPVALSETIRANLTTSELPLRGVLERFGVGIEWIEVAHPGGCSAFALTIGTRRFVFSGDVEIPQTDRPDFVSFCRNAEALICDAQYTREEYPNHQGWGHSTNFDAANVAADAHAGSLLLTHHDPSHDDDTIDAMVDEIGAVFPDVRAAACGTLVASGEV